MLRTTALRSCCSKKTNEALFQKAASSLNQGIGRGHKIFMTRGSGSYLYDSDDRKYLDFGVGIGVCNLGHCHPRLVAALQKQATQLWHGQVAFGVHEPMADLMENMKTLLPKELDNFSFVTTGAEAVEAALKLARAHTGRPCTVALQGSFHGRTVATAALTSSKYIYAYNMRPLMPGVSFVPPPYHTQMKVGKEVPSAELSITSLKMLDDVLSQQVNPSEVAMLIVEPVMGEGGYVPLPMEYYRGLREYTKKHGIVFVVDEIQSGFGRTGKPFAFQHYEGVEAPDVILFAKGVANGIPLSGIVAQKAFTARQVPGQQGGTYAGNALACAVANEVIATMKEEQIFANVDARSAQLMNGLKDMIRRNPTAPIAEVRGRGLMIGIEFDANATGVASAFVEACTARNLIVMTTSKYEVVRLIPPLNVTEGECASALAILEEALVEATAKKQAARQLNGKQFTGFFADGDAGSAPLRYVPQFA